MADLKQQKKFLLGHKLEYLEQKRTHLHNIVDRYVDGLISTEEIWRSDNCVDHSYFQDLSQQLDNAAIFLSEKGAEISDRLEEAQTIGCAQTVPRQSSPDSGISGMNDQIKSTLSDIDNETLLRVEAIEKSLDMLQKRDGRMFETEVDVGQLLARQDEIEKKIEDLSSNLCKSQKIIGEMSANYVEVKDNIMDLFSQQSGTCSKVDELLSKVVDTEEKLDEISTVQGESQVAVQEILAKHNETERKLDDISTNLDEMDNEMKKLLTTVDETEHHCKDVTTKCHEMEEIINDISMSQRQSDERIDELSAKLMESDDKMDEIALKQWENGEKITAVSAQTIDIERKMKDLSTEICQVNQSLKDSGQLMDKLSEKIMKTEKEIQDLSDMDRFSEMEKKMKKLERNAREELQFFDKQFQHVKSKYDMIRHMVDHRLVSLEKLRDILNQKIQGQRSGLRSSVVLNEK